MFTSEVFKEVPSAQEVSLYTHTSDPILLLAPTTLLTEAFKFIREGCQKHLQEEMLYFRGLSPATGFLFARKESNAAVLTNLNSWNFEHLKPEHSQSQKLLALIFP